MNDLIDRILFLEDVYDYSESFERYIPEYSEMKGKHKRALNVICTVASPIYEMSDEGLYLILHRDIMNRGVDYRVAMEALTLYPLFTYTGNDWGHVKKIAKQYQITEMGKNILVDEVSDHWKYLRMEGKKGKLYTPSRIPRVVKGVSLADYSHDTEINYDRLEKFVKDNCKSYDTETFRMLHICKKLGKSFKMEYVRHSEGGRLFSVNGANMQNLHTDARQEAYHGMWDVDFENAHYAITHQIVGGSAIKYYVDNTKKVRGELSDTLSLPIANVKQIMIMIIYNASFSGNDGTDMTKLYDAQVIENVKKHPFLKELMTEVKALDKVVKKEKGNIYWKYMARERSLYLQRIEAKMLDICISKYSPQLLLFDGFITKEDVDVDLLSDMIYTDLGFNIRVCKEIIGG